MNNAQMIETEAQNHGSICLPFLSMLFHFVLMANTYKNREREQATARKWHQNDDNFFSAVVFIHWYGWMFTVFCSVCDFSMRETLRTRVRLRTNPISSVYCVTTDRGDSVSLSKHAVAWVSIQSSVGVDSLNL